MKNRTWKFTVISAALVLAASLVPFSASAEEASASEPSATLEQALATQEHSQSTVGKSEGDLIPISCLSSTPLSCADLPSTHNSTCSCSSELQPVRCKSCQGGKGQVVKTTCTIRFTCTSSPCDLQQNITRTGYSCAS